jgi:ribosome-associated protein
MVKADILKLPNLDSEFSITFARSSGPGGQNVNKTNSKAVLTWDIDASALVPQAVKGRFKESFRSKLSGETESEIVIHSDETRDRMQNEENCKEKLYEMLEQVWLPPKERKATKPTRSSQRRRVDDKKRRGAIKSGRGRVSGDW